MKRGFFALPPMGMLQRICRIMFALGVASIVVLSLLPYPIYGAAYFPDKLEHAVAYALVSLLGGLAFGDRRTRWAVVLGLIGLGVAMEFAQLLVPGRLGEVADIMANCAGVAGGTLAAHWISGNVSLPQATQPSR